MSKNTHNNMVYVVFHHIHYESDLIVKIYKNKKEAQDHVQRAMEESKKAGRSTWEAFSYEEWGVV